MNDVNERGEKLDFLQSFLDESPNGVMIFEAVIDIAGQIIDFEWRLANVKAVEWLALPDTKLFGKRLLQELQGQDSRAIFELGVEVLKTGETGECENSFGTNYWFLIGLSRLQDKLVLTMKDVSKRHRVQVEIEKKHEELDRFFNLALDLLTVANSDGILLKVNKAWEYCLGYTIDELEGKAFIDFVHPDDVADTLHQVNKLIGQEPVLNFVNRYRTIDGTYRYIEWRSQPFGKLNYAAGRDITEARLAEEAMRHSERQFRALFEQSNDAVFIFDLDGTNKIVNQQAADLLGYSLEEIYKLGTRDISAEVEATFGILNRLKQGEHIAPYERLFRHKDGSLIPVEVNIALVRDELGQPVHFQSIVRDIRERKKAEMDLRERERQFRALFEQSNDVVFITNLDGTINKANLRSEELFGYTQEELEGLSAALLSAEQDASHEKFRAVLAGQRLAPFERLMLHKDGSVIPVEINIELVHDEAGKPRHIQSIIRDIRERKKAEAALEAKIAEELIFQDYLKGLQDIVIELTAIKNLDDFYRRAVELGMERFGFERLGLMLYDYPDAIGTYGTDRFGKLIPEHDLRVDPNIMTTILARAMQREEHFVYDEDADLYSQFELIGRGQNAVAVLWNGEEKLGWLAIDNAVKHRAISQAQLEILALYALSLGSLLAQRRIQESLRESETLYRSIVTMMAEGLVLQDSSGRIIAANPAAERMLGVRSANMVGSTAFDPRWQTIHEDGTPFEKEQHPSVLALRTGKPIADVVMGMPKPEGETVWLMVSAEPLFYPNEAKPHAVVITFADISKRIKAQQQALELQIEKERINVISNFIQGSSHEFRTPLAIIKSNVYLMKRLDDPVKRSEKGNAIELQIDRILGLLTMLNKMSQLDGNITMKWKQRQIIPTLENVCMKLQSMVAAKNLEIKVTGENVVVWAAEEFLMDAFTQLILNAIQFSNKGGEIRIMCWKQADSLFVSIEDDGDGMSADVASHIFERFYRMDTAHSTAGFGLGLPLAQSVIEKHGGDIYVESELGKGSRFVVRLPLTEN